MERLTLSSCLGKCFLTFFFCHCEKPLLHLAIYDIDPSGPLAEGKLIRQYAGSKTKSTFH